MIYRLRHLVFNNGTAGGVLFGKSETEGKHDSDGIEPLEMNIEFPR